MFRILNASILTVLTGCLTFMAFPTAWFPELSLYPLIWFSHVPILWFLRDKGPKASFWWGWLTGTLINVGGYYWIAHMLGTFGGFPGPLAAVGSVIHGAHLGLMWGIWALIVNRITNTTSVGLEWAVPATMVAVELCFPRVFPAAMGNSQFPFIEIMQICDMFGVAAVTFLIYRVNAVLFLWIRAVRENRPKPIQATKVTLVMLVCTLGYGFYQVHRVDESVAQAPTLHVGVVEGDVGIFQVESRVRIRDHLRIQQRLSKTLSEKGVELIVWSESSMRTGGLPRAVDVFPPQTGSLELSRDEERAVKRSVRVTPQRGFSTPLLFGTTSYERRTEPRWAGDTRSRRSFNTAFLLDGNGRVSGRYDKLELLVFGEYVPFVEYLPQFYDWVPAAGDLERGESLNPLILKVKSKTARIGMLVCYEGILPSFVRDVMENEPNILINITNDDWFGKTAERYLHLALAIPRAIEHRRSFVRSTLTGVSAFIDPVGRLVEMTRMTDAETMNWKAPLLDRRTFYQAGGHHFSTLCLVWVVCMLMIGYWRRRSILR
jgi:apolipoprotein N-acyltransferase